MPMAMPSTRPSRAVSAVERRVLLNLGHHRGGLAEQAEPVVRSPGRFHVRCSALSAGLERCVVAAGVRWRRCLGPAGVWVRGCGRLAMPSSPR